MPFKYSPLIHACECADEISNDCHSTYYVKEIIKKQVGVNGPLVSFAQLYAKESGGGEHYHGPYAVDVDNVKGEKIKEAEKQIQQMPEFTGDLHYDGI
jgi:hypothetical protein